MNLTIDIQFTERAKAYLPPGENYALSYQAVNQQIHVLPQDKLRIEGIPNCPWFVVKERYWSLGQSTTLTIWLDEIPD